MFKSISNHSSVTTYVLGVRGDFIFIFITNSQNQVDYQIMQVKEIARGDWVIG